LHPRRNEQTSSTLDPASPENAPYGADRQPVEVHIVAPSLVSWGLQRLVQTAGARLRVIGASLTLKEAVPLLQSAPADVVLVDLDDGYVPEDIGNLSRQVASRILVLTGTADRDVRDRVMAAGAQGIFQKHHSPGQLLKALESIASGACATKDARNQGEEQAGATAAPMTTRDSRLVALTARERQTVAAVIANASAPARAIAEGLSISEHTLRNHLNSIYSKLEVGGRLGLQALMQQQTGRAERS
jgi:two-component system, NarL family, nitrate/nitrite response regulator NarL